MKIKHHLATLLIFSLLTCIPAILNAQFDDPDPTPPRAAPFDGGLSLLVAAGVGYAIKRKHDARKKDIVVKDKDAVV